MIREMRFALLLCLLQVSLFGRSIVIDTEVALPAGELYFNAIYWRPSYGAVPHTLIQPAPLTLARAAKAAAVSPGSHGGYEIGARVHAFHPSFFIGGRYLSFDTSPARNSIAAQGTLLLPIFGGSRRCCISRDLRAAAA